MTRFHLRVELPVRKPYRLDLTTEALRRLAANVVDVVTAEARYYRALVDARGTNVVSVCRLDAARLEVRFSGRDAMRWMPVIKKMLGTNVNLELWMDRVTAIPWLAHLAHELHGLKPPRYPSLWEALAHAIVFQQISIHAAASIMRRTVEALSPEIEIEQLALRPFPRAVTLLAASDARLRACGLSTNKVAHLRACGEAIVSGVVSDAQIEALSTPAASDLLCTLRGIGRWSAAVVLLRGSGRLDTFPPGDSGVARALRLLSGDPKIDEAAVLEHLGAARGMLYFHLLLGRLRNLVPPSPD
jgi:DNA-3-methyladenine glycosylase II